MIYVYYDHGHLQMARNARCAHICTSPTNCNLGVFSMKELILSQTLVTFGREHHCPLKRSKVIFSHLLTWHTVPKCLARFRVLNVE